MVAFAHNFGFVHYHNNWKEVEDLRTFLNYLIISLPRITWRFLAQEWPFYQSCRAVVSGSYFNARILRAVYRVPQARLRVIQNWVDCALFRPDLQARQTHRRRLQIPEDALVYLLVGSTWRPKGFHVAIKSFGIAARRVKNAWLVLAGLGTNKDPARRLAAQFINPLARVTFLGPVVHSEVASLLNVADVFLMPTLLSEVLPYAALEAQSTGLPVIATDIGGNRELVEGAGVLVSPGDAETLAAAMENLADDADLRRRLALESRRRAEGRFSEKAAEPAIAVLIEKLGSRS